MSSKKIVIVCHTEKKTKPAKRRKRRRQSDACGEIRAAVVRRCWQ